MRIKVWGCRGSLATPGAKTLRYGGHTTCLEIRTSEGRILIVDAGSGLRNLGQALLKEKGLHHITFLFTHAHWDHLNGFPFFAPAYLPQFALTFCGGPAAQESLRGYMTHQMQAPFFPIEFLHLKARLQFGCQCGCHQCEHKLPGLESRFRCQALPLNHPNAGYGFRFGEHGQRFVFLTDNELRFHHPGGLQREDYVQFCAGADLLFHDAQYTDKEYERTRGWGHSTFFDAVDLAMEAGVKRLGLFHHDPDRSDDALDEQVALCRKRITQAGAQLSCFAAAENMVLTL